MRKIISLQPDFAAQKTRLEEVTLHVLFFFLIFCNLIFLFFVLSLLRSWPKAGATALFFSLAIIAS